MLQSARMSDPHGTSPHWRKMLVIDSRSARKSDRHPADGSGRLVDKWRSVTYVVTRSSADRSGGNGTGMLGVFPTSIKRFTHKGVEEVFRTGRSRKIGTEFHKRMSLVLDAIDGATCAGDLRGARGFHALHGDRSGTFAMSVSGNRRLTFRFEHGDEGDVLDIDFEDYH